MSESDRALEAFHRLLADGSAGGQAKVDALVALAQRTVLIPTWSATNGAFRTLVNADGDTGLPVFTSLRLLHAAAGRFAWAQPDGTITHQEVGSRAALRHAVAQNLPFVVVDIASPHALEIAHSEITPMLTPEARRESQGPYAGVGRLSSSMLEAVRATPPPGSVEGPEDTATPPSGTATPPSRTATPPRAATPPPRPATPPVASAATSEPVPRRTPPPDHTPPGSQGTGPQAAQAAEPTPAPDPPQDEAPEDITQTGTHARPRRSTPIAHVLGERRRRTPKPAPEPHSQPKVGRATRESAHPPPMHSTGTYGAAARAPRFRTEDRTPPSGSTRPPLASGSRPSSQPASQPPTGAERPAGSASARAEGLRSDVPAGMGASPEAVGTGAPRIHPLAEEPPQPLLDAASAVLREYPEVEWASFCFVTRSRGGPTAAIALRVDDAFRQRVGEIILGLRTAGAQEGTDLDVLMLDDPDTMRLARADGVIFYPWRRSPSRPGT